MTPQAAHDGTIDPATVDGFGREWARFDHSGMEDARLEAMFERYVAVFPWCELPDGAVGVDVGCGSGRWAARLAARGVRVVGLDPSVRAVSVARRMLAGAPGRAVLTATAGALPFRDASFDFGCALGVLHHTHDPGAALRDCVRTLRPGAPFLVYVYYALDGRPAWFRVVWRATDVARRGLSRLPFRPRYWATQVIALTVYWPLARAARLAERWGASLRTLELMPLGIYREASLYTMRNDALDRFGTRLEHRFTRAEVVELMTRSGLDHVEVSDTAPFWCAVGRAPRDDTSPRGTAP